jgi:hypothetical protein
MVSSIKHLKPHVPREDRLPKSVTGWQQMDTKRLWNDGTQIIVAVPVCHRVPASGPVGDDWCYEFSVVVIRCDEDFFDIETSDGDDWGWDLDCVDFYAILSE